MSDSTQMQYFKDKLLAPMLIPRVSGTEENKQVQQVSILGQVRFITV